MLPIKILALLLFACFIFGCTRKKKTTDSLVGWLEKHFPNRFQILETLVADPVRNLSFKVKNSVVAEKTDSLLQIRIKWDARKPDFGLSPGEIDSLFVQAKLDLAEARSLFDVLKTAGFSKVSASVQQGFAKILIFEEPTLAARRQCAERLKTVFSHWPEASKYGYWLVFMEPGAFGAEFGDIVPQAFWARPDSWRMRNTLVSQQIRELGQNFDVREIEKNWQFNTESDRLGQWVERARPVAERWAAEHLKKPVSFSTQTEYSILEKKLGAELRFPFSEAAKTDENTEISGHIVGDFLFDKDVFENLRIQDD